MNVFELEATIKANTSEYESALKGASDATSEASTGISAKAVAIGQFIGNMAIKAAEALGKMAKAAWDAGTEWQTSMAQVTTIMDTSIVSTEDMSSAIKDLSSDMGISANEIASTVYNAISATGDTAHAVELAANASKLATAGFTDTESALSVLTTAMNAYGLSAEEATSISDSLITVQNLGVTTVSELSASMGKAIASASAYGVDLNNLESAYVSLTKGGINTAESTTYISSMLKELGSEGSTVAKVIQSETGKSFAELMNEGASLGDVLGILNESVDGDATAMMNLWSSAEAGKASNAIVNQGLEEFNSNLSAIANSAGATDSAYATMSDTIDHKISVLKQNGMNLLTDVFEKFSPLIGEMLDAAIEFVEGVDTQKIYDGFTKVIAVIRKVIDVLKIVIKAVIDFVKKAIAQFKVFKTNVTTTFNNIKSTVTNTFNNIKNFITKVFNAIKNTVNSVGTTIKKVFTSAWSGVKAVWNNAVSYYQNIWNSIKLIFSAVESVLSGDFQGAWNAIKGIIDLWAGYFSGIWSDIKDVFSDAVSVGSEIVDNIKSGINDKWTAFKEWLSGLWSSVKSMFTIDLELPDWWKPRNASGVSYVAHDMTPAYLDRGEMVLNAVQASRYRQGKATNGEPLEGAASGVSVTNNFYPQTMTQAQMQYMANMINRQLGGKFA